MSLDSVLDELSSPDARLTSALLVPLSNLDAAEARALAEDWTAIDERRRLRVLAALADLAEDNVELNFDAVFKLALTDGEGSVRAAAIRGLIEYEGRDLIGSLTALLRNDPDAEVRRESAVALGRYAIAAETDRLMPEDAEMVKEALTEAASDLEEEDVVRAAALEAVGAFSGEDTENLIESVYQEGDIGLMIAAVDAMGRSCNAAWLPIVYQQLASPSPEMRHAAAFAAGSIASEESVPYLEPLAFDPDPEVRIAAVRALGEIGGDEARVVLKRLLYEGGEELQEAVQDAIAEAELGEKVL
jgi:HEAT repeat protein